MSVYHEVLSLSIVKISTIPSPTWELRIVLCLLFLQLCPLTYVKFNIHSRKIIKFPEVSPSMVVCPTYSTYFGLFELQSLSFKDCPALFRVLFPILQVGNCPQEVIWAFWRLTSCFIFIQFWKPLFNILCLILTICLN